MSKPVRKSKTAEEVLARFEEAVEWKYVTANAGNDSDIRIQTMKRYEAAKAEIMHWLRK